jgi:hypothetical protein
MRFSAHGFFVVKNKSIRNPGNQEWRKGISDIEGKAGMGSGEEATGATEFQKNLRADQLPGFVASRFNQYELS